ncbi:MULTISPECIES: hypothetical protein [unclassified Moorena]|nr:MULTISPECIES: hypothetical protein [unclassified Moorena]NEQ05494.1 hypothetical protein [Moorena sp. SIO4E2]OLT69211.1 hypothetical protein BI334_10585 [Moorena producens 3L]NEP32004.1 hypothetical protein [Moorena sp. SIO3B2]NEP68474.1 hypothetical protein [Moorena sp. SIO3A5]NER90486.1 hypothetical protein [Moorena sp. SIO3A2]
MEDDWSKSIFETLESVANMVDEFFEGVSEVVEEFANEIDNALGAEIDQCLQEIVEPFVEIYFDFEVMVSETDEDFPDSVTPSSQKHPACIGCRHYHGQAYGGNLLVCAMHPYGWDTEDCPDWESHPRNSSNRF